MSENTNQLPQIPQNWDFFMCRIDEKPGSIRLNLALYNIAPLENYSQRVVLAVKMKNPTPEGLSSNEEFDTLNKIEDLLYDKTISLGVITAGVIKTDGLMEIYMYTQNIDGIEEICAEIFKNNFPTYQWKLRANEDANWDTYFNFLYPDMYSYQVMQNRKVLQKLQESDDNLENTRQIDHWLYFMTEESVAEFSNKAREIGYTVLSSEKIDNGEYPHQIKITREDAPVAINNITWELLDLAVQLQGYYDGWGCVLAKD